MFEQILFPTDGSDGAAFAFEHVLDIAARHDATVHVLNVVDTTQNGIPQIRGDDSDALEQEGERIVREAADRPRQRGVEAVTELLEGEPYREIVDHAETRGFDLVVVPTHGRRGLERFLLGSTSERVVRRADVPVLAIRPDDVRVTYPYRDVLVPTDGSDCANQALAIGVDVAAAEDAALHLLSAIAIAALGVDVRTDIQMEMLEESARELPDEAATFAEDAGGEDGRTRAVDPPGDPRVRRGTRRRPRRRRNARPDRLRPVRSWKRHRRSGKRHRRSGKRHRRSGKRHRVSRPHVSGTGVDRSRTSPGNVMARDTSTPGH